jgi:hypothetical protein
MTRVAFALWAAFALCAHAAPPRGGSLSAAEWTAIRQVIGEQLVALKVGDGSRALNYAMPDLRAQFGTPEDFLWMVRHGYRALLDARSSTFLEGAVVDGATIQPLQLVLPDNTVKVALYEMRRQKDGRWRIAGCVIAPSKAQAI